MQCFSFSKYIFFNKVWSIVYLSGNRGAASKMLPARLISTAKPSMIHFLVQKPGTSGFPSINLLLSAMTPLYASRCCEHVVASDPSKSVGKNIPRNVDLRHHQRRRCCESGLKRSTLVGGITTWTSQTKVCGCRCTKEIGFPDR